MGINVENEPGILIQNFIRLLRVIIGYGSPGCESEGALLQEEILTGNIPRQEKNSTGNFFVLI